MNNPTIIEEMKDDTLCPHCLEELNDDDGVFFDKFSDTKRCPHCEFTVTYVKQFTEEPENPFTPFVWNKTYFQWSYDI